MFALCIDTHTHTTDTDIRIEMKRRQRQRERHKERQSVWEMQVKICFKNLGTVLLNVYTRVVGFAMDARVCVCFGEWDGWIRFDILEFSIHEFYCAF